MPVNEPTEPAARPRPADRYSRRRTRVARHRHRIGRIRIDHAEARHVLKKLTERMKRRLIDRLAVIVEPGTHRPAHLEPTVLRRLSRGLSRLGCFGIRTDVLDDADV